MDKFTDQRAVMACQEYVKHKDNYLKVRSTWFYNILIAGCGLLGALVALSNNSQETFCIRILFVSTIILLTLGILSAAIALYYDIYRAKSHTQAIHELLKNISSDKSSGHIFFGKDSKAFALFEIISYLFFSLSFVSLIVFVVLKNLPELL